jgi:hypothetical protein
MLYRRPLRRFTPEALNNMRFRYEESDEPQQSIADDYGIHRKTLDRIAKDEGWILRKHRLPRDVPAAARIEAEAEQALRALEEGRLALASGASGCPHPNPPPQAGEGLKRDAQAGEEAERDAKAGKGIGREAQAEGIESNPEPPLSIADRLERAVEKELAAVERKRMFLGARPESVTDGEKTARTLASLTDTLHKIARLHCPDAPLPAFGQNNHQETHDDLPADIDEFRLALARRIEAFVRSRGGATVPSTGDAGGGEPPQP